MDEKKTTSQDEDDEIIINKVDGLPNVHPNYEQIDLNCKINQKNDQCCLEELIHDEDLPTSIIVTNVDPRVFKTDQELKTDIERLFKQFDKNATFQYFRSFKRMRVNYTSPSAAAQARIQLHQTHFGETNINCYFAQPVTPIDVEDQHLQPPAPHKQFLISPPASPPLGWEPRKENEPLVNHDLLAAIANLTPGESHQLHPKSTDQPGIVVHICENINNSVKSTSLIPHTRCPD